MKIFEGKQNLLYYYGYVISQVCNSHFICIGIELGAKTNLKIRYSEQVGTTLGVTAQNCRRNFSPPNYFSKY